MTLVQVLTRPSPAYGLGRDRPRPVALFDSGHRPDRPEWEFRDRIGIRLPARRAVGEIVGAVTTLLSDGDSWRGLRAIVGETMIGTYTTPDSADRLIEALTR